MKPPSVSSMNGSSSSLSSSFSKGTKSSTGSRSSSKTDKALKKKKKAASISTTTASRTRGIERSKSGNGITKTNSTTTGSPALLGRKKPPSQQPSKAKSMSGRFNGNKSLSDVSIFSQSNNSNIKSLAPIRPLGPVIYDHLPDPRDLMKQLTQEVKDLKGEVKKQFQEMEEAKQETDEAIKEARSTHRKQQVQRLEGNELMKVEHLLKLGFDEDIVKEHLEKVNRSLEKEVKLGQQEKGNLEQNITKMVHMNRESENAVIAAHGAIGPLVVKQQALQAKLEQVELELYSVEARAVHRRNMRSVELVGKDKFKTAIKTIARKMEQRCKDQDLVHDMLKIAGRAMSSELGLSDHGSEYGSGDDEEDVDDENDNTESEEEFEMASSDSGSVSVSSVASGDDSDDDNDDD